MYPQDASAFHGKEIVQQVLEAPVNFSREVLLFHSLENVITRIRFAAIL